MKRFITFCLLGTFQIIMTNQVVKFLLCVCRVQVASLLLISNRNDNFLVKMSQGPLSVEQIHV